MAAALLVFAASVAHGGPKPAATSPLFNEGFEDDRLLQRGFYDGSRFKITTTEAHAGKGSIEFHWPRGATNPDTSDAMRRLFEPTDTVYLRFWLRLSPGWGWSGRSYHPHLMHFLTTENDGYHGPAASHLTLYVEPQEGRLRLATQDIENAKAPHGLTQGLLKGGYNGVFWDSKEIVFKDDRWHLVEAEFRLNSLDADADRPRPDGQARGWVDGKLVIEQKDVVFRSTDFPRMKFNQYLLAPYFGQGLLPHEQTLWIDDLSVGRLRPD